MENVGFPSTLNFVLYFDIYINTVYYGIEVSVAVQSGGGVGVNAGNDSRNKTHKHFYLQCYFNWFVLTRLMYQLIEEGLWRMRMRSVRSFWVMGFHDLTKL